MYVINFLRKTRLGQKILTSIIEMYIADSDPKVASLIVFLDVSLSRNNSPKT